jgi:hypothetical protein
MRARAFTSWLGILLLGAVCSVLAGAPSEYEVKAAYLFNFSQFVSWPASAFGSADAPLVIAVLGRDPFGAELDALVRGEHVGERPLRVERYGQLADLRQCHILFIDRSEAADLAKIVEALHGRSVLTVSDIADATHSGVMIDLVNEQNHIRMQINLAAARESGLTLSSKLLRPAQIVGPEGG